jgi:hypothetical protein
MGKQISTLSRDDELAGLELYIYRSYSLENMAQRIELWPGPRKPKIISLAKKDAVKNLISDGLQRESFTQSHKAFLLQNRPSVSNSS